MVPSIEVHDIDDGHKLVRGHPDPHAHPDPAAHAIRGMMAHAPSRRLYLSHYASVTDRRSGWILCADLVTGVPIWHRKYESAIDSGAITPDGKKIYMPSGEAVDTEYFYVIDAQTGEKLRAKRDETPEFPRIIPPIRLFANLLVSSRSSGSFGGNEYDEW